MLNSSSETILLRSAAEKLFKLNRRTAKLDGKEYVFHCPSSDKYPFQWFWDSCFHAIVLSSFGGEYLDLAKKEIEGLLAWQRPDGFIPHVIFWDQSKVKNVPWHWNRLESKPIFQKPKTSEMTQPPVLALALEKIWQTGGDRDFLEKALPQALSYYRWLFEACDPDKDSLISIIAPFESGLDWSPEFDGAFGLKKPNGSTLYFKARGAQVINKYIFGYDRSRILRSGPFSVEEVLVNAIFAHGLDALGRLLDEVGALSDAEWARRGAAAVTDALIKKCYDVSAGAFFSLSGKAESKLNVLTAASLMPLILKNIPENIVNTLIDKHILSPGEFFLPFPLPFVSAAEETFSPESCIGRRQFIWRGPTWININWFLFHGLKLHGRDDLADHLAAKTRKLVELSGFREYYNPYTGEGHGAKNFGWSTLVLDMV